MKINDIKHNHSLTDLLKVGIFSILMCAPLIAIGSTCAYTIVNKNAFESYDGGNIKTLVNLTSGTVYDGSTYEVNYTTQPQDYGYSQLWIYSEISIDPQDYGFLETYDGVQLFNNGTIGFRNADTQVTEYAGNVWGVTLSTFTFKCKEEKNIFIGGNSTLDKVVYVKNSLDNVFYYATEKMTQSDLFNWTENTAIYTGVSAMCTQLDIETNVIPILIVYWFILTIIYVIIDIVLKTFTTLTHMLSKETH